MASSNSSFPIRKGGGGNKMLKPHLSPLQTLLQMGFPKHRAEKALAATGNHSAELATNWLLSHVNDPFLDDNSPREYILYACPKGALLEHLKEYWEKSLYFYGWNGAHNFTPHITLVSFFKTPDEDAPHLVKSLESVMERDGAVLNEPLKLETYSSPNFMGFFVAEEHADYLKRIAMQFVKEVSNATCFPWCTTTTARCIPRGSRSISLEPHVKSLHLTLAYQFPSNQYNSLKAMVDELDSSVSGEWELRLYSRDPRLNGKQVYKVVREYPPVEGDDLELKVDDYLYVGTESVASSATDGWLEGTSWLTGCSGYFPESYTIRSPESDAWTLHKSVALNKCESLEAGSSGGGADSASEMGDQDHQPVGTQQVRRMMNNITHLANFKNVEAGGSKNAYDPQTRKIFIMRHGERVDFVFGSWIPFCFDEDGNYVRKDLNMPASLPVRKSGPEGFLRDSPLTTVGCFQARNIGEGFKTNNVDVEHVYCSPSFRCLQTCDEFLQGLGKKDDLKIRIEPGLFEWMHWYDVYPDWMSQDDLLAAGFNIDTEYTPFMTEEQVKDSKETCEHYYSRSSALTNHLLSLHSTGNMFLMGHASTLDTCARDLLKVGHRKPEGMLKLLQKIPYCSLAQLSFDGSSWRYSDPPCPPITHSTNTRFDWKILMQD